MSHVPCPQDAHPLPLATSPSREVYPLPAVGLHRHSVTIYRITYMGAPSACYLSTDLNKFIACIHQHSPEPFHSPERSPPHLSTPVFPWSRFFGNLILGRIPCAFSWWCAFKFPLSLSVFRRLMAFFFLTPSNIPSYIPPLCNLFSCLLKEACSSQITKWEQL